MPPPMVTPAQSPRGISNDPPVYGSSGRFSQAKPSEIRLLSSWRMACCRAGSFSAARSRWSSSSLLDCRPGSLLGCTPWPCCAWFGPLGESAMAGPPANAASIASPTVAATRGTVPLVRDFLLSELNRTPPVNISHKAHGIVGKQRNTEAEGSNEQMMSDGGRKRPRPVDPDAVPAVR